MQYDIDSMGSDVGREIPSLHGAGMPAIGMYMAAEEEFHRIVHAWRGANTPAQSAISRQYVEELAKEAEEALQATTTQ